MPLGFKRVLLPYFKWYYTAYTIDICNWQENIKQTSTLFWLNKHSFEVFKKSQTLDTNTGLKSGERKKSLCQWFETSVCE